MFLPAGETELAAELRDIYGYIGAVELKQTMYNVLTGHLIYISQCLPCGYQGMLCTSKVFWKCVCQCLSCMHVARLSRNARRACHFEDLLHVLASIPSPPSDQHYRNLHNTLYKEKGCLTWLWSPCSFTPLWKSRNVHTTGELYNYLWKDKFLNELNAGCQES